MMAGLHLVLVVFILPCCIMATDEGGSLSRDSRSFPYWWGNWGRWSACHVDCHLLATRTFEHTRTRQCHGFYKKRCQVPHFYCGRNYKETKPCPHNCAQTSHYGSGPNTGSNIGPSITDGHHQHNHEHNYVHNTWGTWTAWTTCHVDCSARGGQATTQSRSRVCMNTDYHVEVPSFNCENNWLNQEIRACPHNCPTAVDGAWGTWQLWSGCSATCGMGLKKRFRSCDRPAPQNGGKTCEGSHMMPSLCFLPECVTAVDGGWSNWNDWASCSHTCGQSTKTRSRSCDNPAPKNGGKTCDGNAMTATFCNTSPCPIDGGWSNWNDWASCSHTCGQSTKTRSRSCDNPAPKNGGKTCDGNAMTATFCKTSPCPIDGGWGNWTAWTPCDRTCGGGVETRARDCNTPAPQYGGSDCSGSPTEARACNTDACPVPVDGGWTAYATLPCSKSCGGGVTVKYRTCTNPSPADGGQDCSGQAFETLQCNTQACDVDGGWSDWSAWSSCDVVCGDGHTKRTRTCTNPAQSGQGANCNGTALERQLCNNGDCPDAIKTCNDADIQQKLQSSPAITDTNTTPGPAVTCAVPETMQEFLLGRLCHVSSKSVDWTLGTKLTGSCEQTPLYTPVALVDKQTQDRKYGILLDCYEEVLQIVDFSCRFQVQFIPMNHTSTDHHLVLM